MDTIIDQINKTSVSEGRTPVYTAPCRENSCSILKKDSFIVVTDKTVDFYSQASGTLRISIPLISILSISINKFEIYLKFQQKSATVFSDIFAAPIFGALCHVFQQILTSFEAKCLNIDSYNIPRAQHSGYGAVVRYRELYKVNKISASPESFEKLKLALMTSRSEVDISEFGELATVVPIFLGVLPIISSIKSLTIPYIPMYPIYSILAENVAAIARLSYIDIHGRADDNFSKFLVTLGNVPNKRLRGISLTKSEMNVNHLQKLSDFVGTQRLSALGLHDALIIDSYPNFYSEFFNSTMIGSLTVLNLDQTKGLDLGKLIPLLRNIYVLSLDGCGLQIDRVFSQISLSGVKNLRSINISNNICEHFSSSTSIASNLVSVVANNIRWSDLCLFNFLKIFFFRTKSNLKISLANTLATGEEWNRVFHLFGTTTFDNLLSLIWDGNPISNNLFSFLSKNPQLEYLSMSNCLSQTEPSVISVFSRFIECCQSLKFLIVRGGQQRTLGRLVGAITRVAAHKNSLIHIDISDNRIGDQGLSQLKVLYSSSTNLKMINFDGSNPQTTEALFEILELASHSLQQIRTSFPIRDIMKLKQSGEINQEAFDFQIKKFQRAPKLLSSLNSNQLYPIPTNSPFLAPFNIFVDEQKNTFPKYLSQEEIKDILENPDKPFLSTKNNIEFISNRVFSGTVGRPVKKTILGRDLFNLSNQLPEHSAKKAPSVQAKIITQGISMRLDGNINSDDYAPHVIPSKKVSQSNKILKPEQKPNNDYSYEYYSNDDSLPQEQALQAKKQNRDYSSQNYRQNTVSQYIDSSVSNRKSTPPKISKNEEKNIRTSYSEKSQKHENLEIINPQSQSRSRKSSYDPSKSRNIVGDDHIGISGTIKQSHSSSIRSNKTKNKEYPKKEVNEYNLYSDEEIQVQYNRYPRNRNHPLQENGPTHKDINKRVQHNQRTNEPQRSSNYSIKGHNRDEKKDDTRIPRNIEGKYNIERDKKNKRNTIHVNDYQYSDEVSSEEEKTNQRRKLRSSRKSYNDYLQYNYSEYEDEFKETIVRSRKNSKKLNKKDEGSRYNTNEQYDYSYEQELLPREKHGRTSRGISDYDKFRGNAPDKGNKRHKSSRERYNDDKKSVKSVRSSFGEDKRSIGSRRSDYYGDNKSVKSTRSVFDDKRSVKSSKPFINENMSLKSRKTDFDDDKRSVRSYMNYIDTDSNFMLSRKRNLSHRRESEPKNERRSPNHEETNNTNVGKYRNFRGRDYDNEVKYHSQRDNENNDGPVKSLRGDSSKKSHQYHRNKYQRNLDYHENSRHRSEDKKSPKSRRKILSEYDYNESPNEYDYKKIDQKDRDKHSKRCNDAVYLRGMAKRNQSLSDSSLEDLISPPPSPRLLNRQLISRRRFTSNEEPQDYEYSSIDSYDYEEKPPPKRSHVRKR